MGSLVLLSYFWSLNTIPVVKIWHFDLGGLSPPPSTTASAISFSPRGVILGWIFSTQKRVDSEILNMKLEISGHAGHPTPSGTPTMWYPVAQDSHNVCGAFLITLIIKLFTKIMFKVNHQHEIKSNYLSVPCDWHKPGDGLDRWVLGPDGSLGTDLGRNSGPFVTLDF